LEGCDSRIENTIREQFYVSDNIYVIRSDCSERGHHFKARRLLVYGLLQNKKRRPQNAFPPYLRLFIDHFWDFPVGYRSPILVYYLMVWYLLYGILDIYYGG